jgi:ABC-type phosphate transport system auxiliary subunit
MLDTPQKCRVFYYAKIQKGHDIMEDWKTRLQEEYAQLKERYEKLKAENNRQEVALELDTATQTRRCYYANELLRRQQRTMDEYLHLLELRAELEGIAL